jgi:hypothetical protein
MERGRSPLDCGWIQQTMTTRRLEVSSQSDLGSLKEADHMLTSLRANSRQDTYVSVLGGLKSFGGKRHISAQNIRRVEDFNQVHYHLLESLYISLTLRNPNKVSNVRSTAMAQDTEERIVRFHSSLLEELLELRYEEVLRMPTTCRAVLMLREERWRTNGRNCLVITELF